MSKIEHDEYKIQQTFFVEASKRMQSLQESELLPNPKYTEKQSGLFSKIKSHLSSTPEQQLEKAKDNAYMELTNFLATFPNFTYKRNKDGLDQPSFTHSIVKFKEALSTFLMQEDNSQLYSQSSKLTKSLDHLLSLNPVDKFKKTRVMDPLERVRENDELER